MDQTLIVVCGAPVSGKTSVSKGISKELGIHLIDIDEMRFLAFGRPNPNPNANEESKRIGSLEMRGSYFLLYQATHENLEMGRSLIVVATFSRHKYISDLQLEKHPNVRLKIIWCQPQNDSDDEILRRLEKRIFGVNCWSAVNSLEHYKEVKNRFESILFPHLELDTSPPNNLDYCIRQALEYIND